MTDRLKISDARTGKNFELGIEYHAIHAADLRQIKKDDKDRGLRSYDPGYLNTAACKSEITYIDGDEGILRYRGYPIEELAEKKTYPEIAYLLLKGELPTPNQLHYWNEDINKHLTVKEGVQTSILAMPKGSHPMALLGMGFTALSAIYPDAKKISDEDNRNLQVMRLIAKVPTLAALSHRHLMGQDPIKPDPSLSYAGNFLAMMFKDGNKDYKPHPVIEKAMDILFTLHADHEQNCSTTAMRVIGSSQADPYMAVAGALAALSGPLHGGANEAVLQMLQKIGSKENVANHIKRVKEGEERLMGFGHRVYKNYDPRAKIIKETANQVFEVTGVNPLLEIALELERIALEDDYFVNRKLYPNVDFYSGLIYQAMGIPVEMFTVIFALARVSGWLAQWMELILDKDQKIARPRQIYLGRALRHVPA